MLNKRNESTKQPKSLFSNNESPIRGSESPTINQSHSKGRKNTSYKIDYRNIAAKSKMYGVLGLTDNSKDLNEIKDILKNREKGKRP
jgi:hypothetical protein